MSVQTGKALITDLKSLKETVLDASPRKCIEAIEGSYKSVATALGSKKKNWLQKQLAKLS